MSIRLAVQADLPRVVELARRQLTDGPYAGIILDNPQQAALFAAWLLRTGKILLAEEDGHICGLLGFMIANHHFSGQRYAAELTWYVEPGHRRLNSFSGGHAFDLLREAERLAKADGAEYFVSTAPDDRVAGLYKRFGYSQMEVAYRKNL